MTSLTINSKRWRELKQILDAVLPLAAESRAAWLDEHCRNPGLRAQVETLLSADEDAEEYFAGLAGDVGTALDEECPPIDFSGCTVGRYRLIEPLGRGGMGVVYLAERADGAFEQRVAVKLLAMGLAGREGYRRFLAERQILASLEHPAIARLLDGGVTGDGTPYFVMERVEAVPIDRWCDAQRLGLRERIELVCRVCEAVDYAHRRLIVHRDLKPANVLVTANGDPKLLDFGVAKLLGDAAGNLTRTRGAVPMTPSWAAPEQLDGGTITTATDTWALGALAYVLLAGVPAHDFQDRRYEEIRRKIRDGPLAPSAMLARLPEARQSTIAGTRCSEAADLRRHLTGDLDAILLRALAYEPERRYGSAVELAADFERHLQGRPVHARAPTLRYRAGRFVTRNRAAVVVLALAVVSLLPGAGVALWQAGVAARERDQAVTQRLQAEQVTGFLKELFRTSDPDRAQGREVSARQLLDEGAKQVRFAFRESPELRAEMLVLLGTLYYQLGDYERARPLLEDGLAAAEYAGNPLTQARALRTTASLERDIGRPEQALIALEQAEDLLREAGLVPGAAHGSLVPLLARILIVTGRFDEAVERAETALATARAQAELSPDVLFSYLLGTVDALLRAERIDQAEILLREAIALDFESPDLPNRSLLQNVRMATVLQRKGELEEALVYQRRAVRWIEQSYPPGHQWRAEHLRNLATILDGLGRYEEAAQAARQALDIYETVDPEGRSHHRAYLNNLLGLTLRKAERYDEAEQHYRRARDLAFENFGKNDPFYALVLSNLGVLLRERGRYDEAEVSLVEAMETYESVLGPNNSKVGQCLVYLAHLRLDQDRPAEAVDLVNAAFDVYDRTGYQAARARLSALVIRARAFDRLGRVAEAEAEFTVALAIGEAAGKNSGVMWPQLLAAYAEHLLARESQDAPAAMERAVRAYHEIFGAEHPATRRVEALWEQVLPDGLPARLW